MSLTDQAEDDLLDLMFLNTNCQDYGDTAGLLASAAPGSTELTLHTAALSDTDTLQTANEVAYTGYARPTQARSGAGWTSVAGTASNAALIQFGEMTALGPDTVTYMGATMNSASTNYLQIWGQLDNSLIINNGVNPQFVIGALDITLD